MQKCGCNSNGIKINDFKRINDFLKLEIKKEKWMDGFKILSSGFRIPVVKTSLSFNDKLGGCKARWGINRMNYQIQPGLYAIGQPDKNSDILVTANYKLTFDSLRKELSGLNLWLLVLDTKGINVWCAAGKGTFGTKELIQKIKSLNLDKIVIHRKLILPQLGAVGVSAHEVQKETGFQVIYGPVLAKDIKEFIKNSYHKTQKMKEVFFTLKDRLVLIPIELIGARKIFMALILIGAIFYFIQNKALKSDILMSLFFYIGPIFTGAVITPLLLPYLPFRSLALKGWLTGFIWPIFTYFIFSISLREAIYFALILPPFSAFLSLNFTGATTYTSLSGVKKEMRIFLPIIIISILCGLVFKILDLIRLF